MTTILVITKAPIPGHAKTRLCPPCTPEQAAALAEAALRDTLEAATSVTGTETVVVLDGPRGAWLPSGVSVIPQRGEGLDERIAAAFCDAGGAALLIGMDTPQVSPSLLAGAIDTLVGPDVDAVIGRAEDGGWWACGLRRPDPMAFIGVPMSTPWTCESQRRRLHSLGLNVGELPRLRDVDTFDDAVVVADAAPQTHFARTVDALMIEPAAAGSEA